MILITKNLSELKDSITALSMRCNQFKLLDPDNGFPSDYQSYDEAWKELFLSFDHLKEKLGDDRHEQLVDMARQAKAHYDKDEVKWGSFLMQDIRQVVINKPPFAYPEEQYRWPKVRLVK